MTPNKKMHDDQFGTLKELYEPVAALTAELADLHSLDELAAAAARHHYEGRTGDYDHPVTWAAVFGDPPTCPACQQSVLEAADNRLRCWYCGFSIQKKTYEAAHSHYELDIKRRAAVRKLEAKAEELGLTRADLDAFYDRLFIQENTEDLHP